MSFSRRHQAAPARASRATLLMGAATTAALLGVARAAPAEPTADEVLAKMGFSAAEKQRVLKGEFVTSKIGAVSDRDLSFAVAFMIKTTPEALSKKVIEATLVVDDPQVKSYGPLSEEGSLADLSRLQITGEEARALIKAGAGEEMNWSASERAGFQALPDASTPTVQDQLRRMLLARYQSYRANGLAGMAPYDRGRDGVAEPALDLLKASKGATTMQEYMPALQAVLFDYPKATLPGLQQKFLWLKSEIRGKPTYVIAHILAAANGGARAVVRRELYVSTGYNAEQSVAGFLPVEGGTVVVCMSHAFTDQVAGAGGSTKRSIGSRVMASQMREIFERGRKRIER